MDTELNVSWEADSPEQQGLINSIRRIRGNLLAEHTGLRKLSQRKALAISQGLVEHLNGTADREGCRLRRHTMESFLEDVTWIKDLMPDDLSFDPERPIIEESIYEMISRDKSGIFAKGLLLLSELALQPTPRISEPEQAAARKKPHSRTERSDRSSPVRKFNNRGVIRWRVAILGAGIVLVVWLLFAFWV